MKRTFHVRTVRRILAIVAAVLALIIVGVGYASTARADYEPGCETMRWGFLGSQLRTICDGPIRPDGSWERVRRIWTPGGYVPRRTNCYYGCTSTGDYHRSETTQEYRKYVVFPHNVLPDEPGHLPAGHFVIQ